MTQNIFTSFLALLAAGALSRAEPTTDTLPDLSIKVLGEEVTLRWPAGRIDLIESLEPDQGWKSFPGPDAVNQSSWTGSRQLLGPVRLFRGRLFSINTIAAMGDSITSGVGADVVGQFKDSYLGYALFLMDYPLKHVVTEPEGTNFQTGGFTSQQVLDIWLPRVIAVAPDCCVVYAGTNSVDDARRHSADLDVAAAWLFAQQVQIVTGLRAAGIQVVYCTMTPDTFPTSAIYPPPGGQYHAGFRTIRKKVNDLARAQIRSYGAVLCDWAGSLSTVPTDDTAPADSDLLSDNIHPNATGRMRMAQVLASVLKSNFTLPAEGPVPAEGAEAWLTGNPFLAGSSLGLADGWSLSGSAAVKLGSKVSENVQRISMEGAFGSTEHALFSCSEQVTDASLDGTPLCGTARVKWTAEGAPFLVEMRCIVQNLDSGLVERGIAFYGFGSSTVRLLTTDLPATEMLLITPVVVMPGGTGAQRRRAIIQIFIYGDGPTSVELETCGIFRAE